MNRVKILIFLFAFNLNSAAFSKLSPEKIKFYKLNFLKAEKFKTIAIDDPIVDEPVNLTLIQVLDKDRNLLGFLREVSTSTGCDDGCLPVIFTLFYSKDGKLIYLKSQEGLTKKDHEEYQEKDYLDLQLILEKNPKSFKKIKHPSEMVDAITRATINKYKGDVVARSAYTTLRVNIYNQHTLKFLQKLLSPSEAIKNDK